ncbi:hypothetical protein NIES970_24580 [[Synechococcus] sp. NIES-970]|nr:hypothetical protein NIES970_24580 [[Synechococcus] sp. NIES-970]
MFSQIPERTFHNVRWVLTCGWLLLIASLFYDPISSIFTAPEQEWSPFRLRPEECILVQNQCLQLDPYPLGAPFFWGIIVPSAILILLVFGHELWRRICPLSFLSQIPRALGWQRRFKHTDTKSGKVRYEIPKIKPNSWLGRNYLYLQFALLFIGLCFRILFINGDRLFLALWLTTTIVAAIIVGYLYGGKTWCNYFCPMAPVQKIYAEPKGLFTTKAHMSETRITQSMCRTVEDNQEKSACVACQKPCIDIDAEGTYWEGLEKPETKFVYYCYFGLVVGYFFYYYLYAGNWNYYFSGAWAMEGNSLSTLLNSGFYLYGQALPVPKLLAVPLTLGLFTAWGYGMGLLGERLYRRYLNWSKKKAHLFLIRHHLFSICTFLAFNLFFVFGGRPFIRLLPSYIQEGFDILIVLVSAFWLMQVLKREPELYAREGLARRFQKQLIKMKFPVHQYFSGREIDELNPHEVYVMAKVLPGFTQQKREEAYKEVLREALAEGYVNSASSLGVLQHLRTELDIGDRQHETLLKELGVEDPTLLDPNRQRDLENLVRLSGYRQSLERLMNLQRLTVEKIEAISPATMAAQGLAQTEDPAKLQQESQVYLERLRHLLKSYHGLNQSFITDYRPVVALLLAVVRQKKELLVCALLHRLSILGVDQGWEIATELGRLSPTVLQDILADPRSEWHQKLDRDLLEQLQRSDIDMACSLSLPVSTVVETLELLLTEPNALIQAVCLYLLAQFDQQKAALLAEKFAGDRHPLLTEILPKISKGIPLSLKALPTLERITYLFNSDFFQSLDSDTLIALAQRAEVKSFQREEHITEAGDTCRELLLLMEGDVEIVVQDADGTERKSSLLPGRILDELEVLTHTNLMGTIIAKAPLTRVLAIPVEAFDDLLEGDRHLAMKVLELESLRLKTLLENR